jgi:hypothetical protein
MNIRKRLGVVAASSLMAVGVLAAASAAPALAMPTIPNHCSGDVCANVPSVGGGKITIRVWANYYSFVGHFELQTPNHKTYNTTPDTTWHSGGPAKSWTLTDIYGQYCATAWQVAGGPGNYNQIGEVCWTAG